MSKHKLEDAQVAIVTGSLSDSDVSHEAMEVLRFYKIDYNHRILSAHRSPNRLDEHLEAVNNSNVQVIIGIAGMAAHLPGVIAAKTLLPVIGVPVRSTLMGLDALLSIVQMPAGVPVATVALNGGKNAAHLAARILALQDTNITTKLKEHQKSMEGHYNL